MNSVIYCSAIHWLCRMTNPTHPLWEHFESIHIIHRPTYNSSVSAGIGSGARRRPTAFGSSVVWSSGYSRPHVCIGLLDAASVVSSRMGFLRGDDVCHACGHLWYVHEQLFRGRGAGDRRSFGTRRAWPNHEILPAAVCPRPRFRINDHGQLASLGVGVDGSRNGGCASFVVPQIPHSHAPHIRWTGYCTSFRSDLSPRGGVHPAYYCWRVTGSPLTSPYQVNMATYGWPVNLAIFPVKEMHHRHQAMHDHYLFESIHLR